MSQVIVSPMGGAFSINILAVSKVMDLYKIKNQQDCLERVLFLFDEVRSGQGDECN